MRAGRSTGEARPPRLVMAVIRASLPSADRDPLARELELLWAARAREHGARAANRWLARQALGFAFRVLPARWLPGGASLDSVVSDARVSIRTFRRAPAFVATFVLTLAIAIGVLATVYSAAHWVLLRPVPGVRGGDRLITMRLGERWEWARAYDASWGISQPDLATLQQRITPLDELAAMTSADVDVQVRQAPPRRMAAEMVTTNYFHVLGARVFAGRTFGAEDETDAAPRTTVLSYQFASTIAEDPASTVGSNVRVNGTLLRVIGVMEPGFRGAELPGRPLLWLPPSALSITDPSARPDARTNRMFRVWQRMIGRLAPGTTPVQVEVAANGVMEAVRKEFHRNSYMGDIFGFQVFPGVGLDPAVRLSARHTLALLMGAATFLLCLAVANLTNLALARTVSRVGAMAVRFALGATRARVARALLVETLMLSVCGGGVALLLVMAGGSWFSGTQLSEFGASLQGMHVDARVVAFVMVTSFAATLVAFLRPAVVTRWRPLESLLRRATPAGEGQRFRSVLVALQVAISMVLLVAAMLLGRTVENLRSVDLGFSPEHLLTVKADPLLHGYDSVQTGRLARAVEERLRGAPGVAAAGAVTPAPLGSAYTTSFLQRHPGDVNKDEEVGGAGYYVTPGFFKALGVPVLAGDQAWSGDSGTIVITLNTLRQLYPTLPPASAIGHTVFGYKDVPLRIAAVVADVKLSDLTKDPPPTMFRPLRESPLHEPLSIYVRSSGNSTQALASVHRAMASIAPTVPLYDARSAREAVDLQFAEQRVMAIVASALGALGVALAAIGLYGVLANIVAASEREIAIRAALGAGPRTIVMRVLTRGFVPVAVGAVVGTAGAAAVSRLIASRLFGLQALDPASYGWGLITMATIALVACLPPAVRATRVSIVQMLRAE
jgi:predicted permease